MHDQNSIDKNETPSEKYQRALDLFTESVLKPDHDLRSCSHNQGCYNELMEIREHVLEYLKTLRKLPTTPILMRVTRLRPQNYLKQKLEYYH